MSIFHTFNVIKKHTVSYILTFNSVTAISKTCSSEKEAKALYAWVAADLSSNFTETLGDKEACQNDKSFMSALAGISKCRGGNLSEK